MSEWFADPSSPGLSTLAFTCTMCGNCCTGPDGYVIVTDDEIEALAARLRVPRGEFVLRFTRATSRGRSLADRPTRFGNDCVFLDRQSIPGKALCAVYGDRPAQCRTWPFWPRNLASPEAWRAAGAICPGLNRGDPRPLVQVRVLRDAVDP